MRLSDGPSAVLSTILVAGLAVGLGYGAHAIVGGDDTIDATPAPTSSNVALGDDLCVLMEEMVDYQDDLNEAMFGGMFLLGTEGSSEAEQLDAVHAFGAVLVDVTGTLSDYLSQGAGLVSDPDVAAAFRQLADSTEGLGTTWGAAAIEAESVEDYGLFMDSLYQDPEFLSIMSQGDTASPIVEAYVLDECGIDISGEGSTTVETPALTDANNLGNEIASYYFDWNEGDPHPVITVTDGEYFLNGVFLGEQSPGVALTDQYAEGPDDWCVEVSSDDDPPETYIYSWNGSGYSVGWGVCRLVDVEITS